MLKRTSVPILKIIYINPGTTRADIAETLKLSRATVTRHIKYLRALSAIIHEQERRFGGKFYRVTPSGEKLLLKEILHVPNSSDVA